MQKFKSKYLLLIDVSRYCRKSPPPNKSKTIIIIYKRIIEAVWTDIRYSQPM